MWLNGKGATMGMVYIDNYNDKILLNKRPTDSG